MQAALQLAEDLTNAPLLLYEAAVTVRDSPSRDASWPGKKELKPPKPQPRKRPLTPTEEELDKSPKAPFQTWKALARQNKRTVVVADQSKSRLLSLPTEIREMIWMQVVRDDDDARIKIVWSDGTDAEGRRIRHHRSYSTMLNLLSSCRFVYTEMIALIYSTPTFLFDDYDLFIGWCATILPQRREQIRDLELKFDRHPHGMTHGINSPLTYTPIQHLHARAPLPIYSPPPKHFSKYSTLRGKTFGTPFRVVVDLLCTMNGLRRLIVEIDHGALASRFPKPNLESLSQVVRGESGGLKSLTKESFLIGSDFWDLPPSESTQNSEWPFTVIQRHEEPDGSSNG